MRDNAGIGQGVRIVFVGDIIPTVTHKQAFYVKASWIQHIKHCALAQKSVRAVSRGDGCENKTVCVFMCVFFFLPSVMLGTPCPVPPDKCMRPDL